MKDKVVVYDWNFSTSMQCHDCGERPCDYWQMANIEIKSEKPGMYQMKWVCMNCLGGRVTGIIS